MFSRWEATVYKGNNEENSVSGTVLITKIYRFKEKFHSIGLNQPVVVS